MVYGCCLGSVYGPVANPAVATMGAATVGNWSESSRSSWTGDDSTMSYVPSEYGVAGAEDMFMPGV